LTSPLKESTDGFAGPWTTVGAMSIFLFGIYYFFDSINPDAPSITREHSHLYLGELNSFVFGPGILMAPIAGVLVKRWGVRRSALVFAAICTLATIVKAFYGGYPSGDRAARLLLGLSMEPGIVVGLTAISSAVERAKLGFAIALWATAGRLGSYLADQAFRWWPFLQQRIRFLASTDVKTGHWWLAVLFLLLALVAIARSGLPASKVSALEPGQRLYDSVRELRNRYWLLTIFCVATYVPFYVVRTFGQDLMVEMGLSNTKAGDILSLTSLIPLCCSPIFGWLSDRVSRSLLLLLGSALLSTGCAFVVFQPASFRLEFSILGLGYTIIAAAFWPALQLEVECASRGIANGLTTSIQNFGFATIYVIVGLSHDVFHASISNPNGHRFGNRILFGATVIGVLLAVVYVARPSSVRRGEAAHT
jgi:MFS family permease